MANPAKRKGASCEREVAAILSDEFGVTAKRALGAGRKEDVGDVFGIPSTVIQCVNRKDIARAINEKLPECEQQQARAGALFGATFVRRKGGGYVVCLTVAQFCTLWREAQPL